MSEIFSVSNLAPRGTEFLPSEEGSNKEMHDRFREIHSWFEESEVKIAVQKDGALTGISAAVIREEFGAKLTRDPKRLMSVSEDGKHGFLHARNKALCDLVMNGSVDYAVVGTDRIIESGYAEDIEIIKSYRSLGLWPIVLATRVADEVENIESITGIATQYPVLTKRFLAEQNIDSVKIRETGGGTEAFPYIEEGLEAIVDMSVSGRSLNLHAYKAWNPPVAEVFPVLIKVKDGPR